MFDNNNLSSPEQLGKPEVEEPKANSQQVEVSADFPVKSDVKQSKVKDESSQSYSVDNDQLSKAQSKKNSSVKSTKEPDVC